MGMSIHILKRQNFKLAKCLFSDILNNIVYDLIVTDAHNPLRKRGEQDDHRHPF
jgi:hypothetical protein